MMQKAKSPYQLLKDAGQYICTMRKLDCRLRVYDLTVTELRRNPDYATILWLAVLLVEVVAGEKSPVPQWAIDARGRLEAL